MEKKTKMDLFGAFALIAFSLIFWDPVRHFQTIHIWGLLFQAVIVVAGGFLIWLWILSIYPASGVASFRF